MEEEEAIHVCEWKQGFTLGEDEYADERYVKNLLECLEQHNEEKLEASIGIKEYHVFQINELCVTVGYEGGQSLNIVLKEEKIEKCLQGDKDKRNLVDEEEGQHLGIAPINEESRKPKLEEGHIRE